MLCVLTCCRAELGTLNNVLVVLLVIEALVVQFSSLVYEFVLLRAATSEAMKRCSAFLALPSATIRSMASRQIMVRGAGLGVCACSPGSQ